MQELNRREFAKKTGATLLSAGAGSALLAACGGTSKQTSTGAAGPPKRGGSLKVGIAQKIEDVNPWTDDFYRWTQMIAFTMYEPLIKFGNGGKLNPVLAESWSHSPDYKTWTFNIRQGVRFHTGKELTAADVAYSLNQINDAKNPATALLPLAPGVWAGATAGDSHTVVAKLTTPLALDQQVRRWWMLPENSRSLAGRLESESVGTGPFTLSSFVQGSHIAVERNPNYWNAGLPYLDSMSFYFLTDISTQIANFSSGTVNMLHDVGVLDLKQVQGLNNTKTVPGGIFWHCWLPQMLFGPLANPEVRLALQHAFNSDKLNAVAWAGKGVDFGNPLDRTPYGIHQAPPVYDIALARRMLKSAGAIGQEVDIHVLDGSPTSALEAQVLVEDFNAVGLTSKIVQLDPDAWAAELYTDRTGPGLFNNYGPSPFPYQELLNYVMTPNISPLPPKYPKSPTPSVLAAYNAAIAAYTPQLLEPAVTRAQRLMISEAASYPTFTADLAEIVPQNLQGLQSTEFGDIRFDEAYFS
jgi:peptide/nickel transport system substrate-binding protein